MNLVFFFLSLISFSAFPVAEGCLEAVSVCVAVAELLRVAGRAPALPSRPGSGQRSPGPRGLGSVDVLGSVPLPFAEALEKPW